MGTEERSKLRLIQLEKQRRSEKLRSTYHERKMDQLVSGREVVLDFNSVSDEDKERALTKLLTAAASYDRRDPNAVPLDGFAASRLSAGQFREQLKRAFGVNLTLPELAALVNHFQDDTTSEINSKRFIAHFLKLGSMERDKVRREALKRQRKKKEEHAKELVDQRVLSTRAYWLQPQEFSADDTIEALNSLAAALSKCEVYTIGADALSIFRGVETIDVEGFRRGLREGLHISLSLPQWLALVNHFEIPGTGKVSCPAFLGHVKSLLKQLRTASYRKYTLNSPKDAEIQINSNDSQIDFDYTPEILDKVPSLIQIINWQ